MPKQKSGQYFSPPPVEVQENPRNLLPVLEQRDRLNFYQDERNEPVPPPSIIISNMKHVPARPPGRGVPVPDTVPTGTPIRREETKPKGWFARTAAVPVQDKEILQHKWETLPQQQEGSNILPSEVPVPKHMLSGEAGSLHKLLYDRRK